MNETFIAYWGSACIILCVYLVNLQKYLVRNATQVMKPGMLKNTSKFCVEAIITEHDMKVYFDCI